MEEPNFTRTPSAFAMMEHFSDLVFALAKRTRPDFQPIFEAYGNDAKREAGRVASAA